MASNLGELQFEITADNTALKKTLAQTQSSIDSAAKKSAASLGKIQTSTNKTTEGLSLLGKAAAATGFGFLSQAQAAFELAAAIGTVAAAHAADTVALTANTAATWKNVAAKIALKAVVPTAIVIAGVAAAWAVLNRRLKERNQQEERLNNILAHRKRLADQRVDRAISQSAEAGRILLALDRNKNFGEGTRANELAEIAQRSNPALVSGGRDSPEFITSDLAHARRRQINEKHDKIDAKLAEEKAKEIRMKKAANEAKKEELRLTKLSAHQEKQAIKAETILATLKGSLIASLFKTGNLPSAQFADALEQRTMQRGGNRDFAFGAEQALRQGVDPSVVASMMRGRFGGIFDPEEGGMIRHAGSRSFANIGGLSGGLGASDPAAMERKRRDRERKEYEKKQLGFNDKQLDMWERFFRNQGGLRP